MGVEIQIKLRVILNLVYCLIILSLYWLRASTIIFYLLAIKLKVS